MNKTINLEEKTWERLCNLKSFPGTLDDVINGLINDHYEINKYVQEYIDKAEGKCLYEPLLGRTLIANHEFDINGTCKKCGLKLTTGEAEYLGVAIESKLSE